MHVALAFRCNLLDFLECTLLFPKLYGLESSGTESTALANQNWDRDRSVELRSRRCAFCSAAGWYLYSLTLQSILLESASRKTKQKKPSNAPSHLLSPFPWSTGFAMLGINQKQDFQLIPVLCVNSPTSMPTNRSSRRQRARRRRDHLWLLEIVLSTAFPEWFLEAFSRNTQTSYAIIFCVV